MITFLVAVLILLLGYSIYGWFLEKAFGVDYSRAMPCETKADGVDFVPMSWQRNFLIQLLNIAGLGPIIGAVSGALWGPVAYLWIVLGGIFAGGVHDFIVAHMSIRNDGAGLPELIGMYLGQTIKKLMLLLTIVLLLFVGAAFVLGPARILSDLCTVGDIKTTGEPTIQTEQASTPAQIQIDVSEKPLYSYPLFWTVIIFIYYFLATLLPIDKIIGRFYPIFGASLLLMVILITGKIAAGDFELPEFSYQNLHPKGIPIWPMMMITISCGAISGFHGTQSPMIARTLTSERYSRRVFYGSMLTETFIALVWAAAAMGFAHGNTQELLAKMTTPDLKVEPLILVKTIAMTLGPIGMVLAILGVVALPITTGDTAFRAARLILSDLFGVTQKTLQSRLLLCLPLFAAGILLCQVNFAVLWQYLVWLNQVLAAFTLWAGTVFLWKSKRSAVVTLVPALFMTVVTINYILVEGKIGFGLGQTEAFELAFFLALFVAFFEFRTNKEFIVAQ